jgi:5'-nucleotidase
MTSRAKRQFRTRSLAALSCLAFAPSQALNILITNDDGCEASTIHALYQALKRHGEQVIISSETQDNSGKGGAADFFMPIGPLKQDSRAGGIKAGAPGVGTLPGDPDVFYVDGTPVAATLYGIDVAAPRKWGGRPDLVISGPNYGNNTGLVNNSSGTVNAALIAVNRGVPAIAVSTATPQAYKSFDKLTATDPEYEVAAIVVKLVEALETHRPGATRPLLPAGLGLNVNVPAFASGTASRLPVRLSHEDTVSLATPVFVQDLSQDAGARRLGLNALPALPGVSIAWDTAVADSSGRSHGDASAEQNVVRAGAIAISVIRGNHEAGAADTASAVRRFESLLSGGLARQAPH